MECQLCAKKFFKGARDARYRGQTFALKMYMGLMEDTWKQLINIAPEAITWTEIKVTCQQVFIMWH